jgi:hypothetical protein
MTNSWLVALTERAHCKYITPSKTITQSFFLPTLRHFNSQQRHSKSGGSCELHDGGGWFQLASLDKQNTNAKQKLMSDRKVSPTIWSKDFANFITKWLLAITFTKNSSQKNDTK